MKSIPESGVVFGPYDEKDLFYIEKSKLYGSLGTGLKTVEFVRRTKTGVLFVEAKTNVPNPENKDSSEEKREKFEEFYTDVPDKFVDSLGIYTAAILKRYGDTSEIGENLSLVDLKDKKLTFATVYKGNIIKNLIMDCQSYTKYRPNETTGGIFVSWRRKEELPTGA